MIVQLHRWIVSQHYLTRSPAHQRIGSGGTGEEAELPQKTDETLPGHSARRIDSTTVSHWIVLCCVMQKCLNVLKFFQKYKSPNINSFKFKLQSV